MEALRRKLAIQLRAGAFAFQEFQVAISSLLFLDRFLFLAQVQAVVMSQY